MPDENRVVGPHTKMARNAFRLWSGREPMDYDWTWIAGYVAALEDLPDEMLSTLERQNHAG